MTPQMGKYTQEDADADIATHTADPDAHHPEEIAEGRPFYAATYSLVIPGVSQIVTATETLTSGNIWYYPFLVKTPITIDQFRFEVTAAAGAGEVARLAIYHADANWQPLALVVASPDMAIDAIAVVTADIADTELQEGRYLIGARMEGNTDYRLVKCIAPFTAGLWALTVNMILRNWFVAEAWGAFADPGTVWDSVSAGNLYRHYCFFFRILTP